MQSKSDAIVPDNSDDDVKAAQSVFEQFLLNSPYLNTSSNDNSNSAGMKLKNTFISYEEKDDFYGGMNYRSATAPADISEEIYQLARTITKDLPLMASIAEGLSEHGNFDLSDLSNATTSLSPSNEVHRGELDTTNEQVYRKEKTNVGGISTSDNQINNNQSFATSSSTPPGAGLVGSNGYTNGSSTLSALSPTVVVQRPYVEESEPDMTVESNYTTVMLRNIPNKYTQTSLLEAMDSRGFQGLYNFFYLPVDFKNGCNMGYAFTNFINHDSAVDFIHAFKGFQLPAKSAKVCDACWARVQGLKSNIEHYRNSPVNDLPDPEYRPLLFQNGVEVSFPRPDSGIKKTAVRRKISYDTNDDSRHHHFSGSASSTNVHRHHNSSSDQRSSPSNHIPNIFSNSKAPVKLFIGGLSADTTDQDIRSHFSRFGDVIDAAVVIDKRTGLSRGFGFCSLGNKDASEKIMATRQHIIHGQSVGVRFYQQGK